MVNDIFRDGGSEEPRRKMLDTGPALIDSDSHKKLTDRHKAEKYNMMSGGKEATRFKWRYGFANPMIRSSGKN